ncbi:MAG: mRNA surveillance protein pelota [Methanosarcinales archaeon]
MKVTKKRLKVREGEIALTPESLDDLWHLKYIIEKNDLVFALTKRRVEGATDKIRPEKVEKKTMRLGIRVDSVEFHKFSNRLRLHGIIEQGIDTGSYHTLNIENGVNLSIIKNWKNDQLERIKDSVKASNRPKVVIATLEDGEASIGLVRQYGVEETFNSKYSSGKKERTNKSTKLEFFKALADQLQNKLINKPAIIIAGPGFIKTDFYEFLKNNYPEVAKIAKIEDTSSIGISGFQEVLKRGAVDRIVEESRIAREVKIMDELLKEIAIDGKAVYGLEEVSSALEFGAIETLLIADETLRLKNLDKLLRDVEHSQGKVVVFSTEFEPGKKLESLGGIAALLRYKI